MLSARTARAWDRPKLPPAGSLVVCHADGPLRPGHRWRRFIVEAFPVRSHLAIVRALDNGERRPVSGFWLEVVA